MAPKFHSHTPEHWPPNLLLKEGNPGPLLVYPKHQAASESQRQWLVRSLYRALREESPELTRAHLEQSVLPDAKWERMRADARSGEAEFQYADGQNSYLSELASMPTFTSKQPDPAPPSTPPTADQKTRKPKGHIGEPSPPYRDQVGTVQ